MRVDNWNLKFLERLEELKAQNQEELLGFDWDPKKANSFHCLTFSSTMVEAITGRNIYQEMASDKVYDTPLAAMRVLKDMGFSSVDQLIGSIFEEKRVTRAIRGDLVMIPSDIEEPGLKLVVAVADPPFFWVVSSVHGLSRGNILDAQKAYSVE